MGVTRRTVIEVAGSASTEAVTDSRGTQTAVSASAEKTQKENENNTEAQ